MEVRLRDILVRLEGLLTESESRETASAWAYSAMLVDDKEGLVFVPIEDEERIRDGLHSLILVDAKGDLQSYLYKDHDIIDWIQKLKVVPYLRF